MYAWFFRSLPGPLWARIGITLVLLTGVFLLLMEVVFPWANRFNPLNESTMDLDAAGAPTVPGTAPGAETSPSDLRQEP